MELLPILCLVSSATKRRVLVVGRTQERCSALCCHIHYTLYRRLDEKEGKQHITKRRIDRLHSALGITRARAWIQPYRLRCECVTHGNLPISILIRVVVPIYFAEKLVRIQLNV